MSGTHCETATVILGHLPVVYRATRGDPVFQFGDVLRIAIHLKYVNFNQGAFLVQMSAGRNAIRPPRNAGGRCGPATSDYSASSHCVFARQLLARSRLPRPHAEASRRTHGLSTLSAACGTTFPSTAIKDHLQPLSIP